MPPCPLVTVLTFIDLKLDNFLCRFSDDDSHELVERYLQTNPFSLNPPELSLCGMVQSAKSQPLPSPSFSNLASATFVLSDFGHGECEDTSWLLGRVNISLAQYLQSATADFFTTELYRPPEVIMHGPWGREIDIWALGCIVHILFCLLFELIHCT